MADSHYEYVSMGRDAKREGRSDNEERERETTAKRSCGLESRLIKSDPLPSDQIFFSFSLAFFLFLNNSPDTIRDKQQVLNVGLKEKLQGGGCCRAIPGWRCGPLALFLPDHHVTRPLLISSAPLLSGEEH